jgi:hypothetical protein
MKKILLERLKKLANIKKIFPDGRDIFLVLGIILFAVHSWSIRTFLYSFPSFILYMNIGQITGVFAYMMAFAFLESLLITGILIIVSTVLPRAWYRSAFTSNGFLTILIGAALAINIRMSLGNRYPGIESLYGKVLFSALILIISILITHFIRPLQKALVFIAEQISVMAYIYIPVGILSLIVVFIRNVSFK